MTYKFSEEYIRLIKKRVLITAVASSFFILLLISFAAFRIIPNTKVSEIYALSGFEGTVLMGVIVYFTLKKMNKRFRNMTLELNENAIFFFGVEKTKKVLFSDITRLIIYQNPFSVLIEANDKKYEIFGYEKMDEIGEVVADKVDIALIKQVTRKFNIYNQINIITASLCVLIAYYLYMVVFEKLGLDKFSDPFLMFALGGYMAFFLSETASKFVKKIGLAFIAFSIVDLILVLFFKWDGLPFVKI